MPILALAESNNLSCTPGPDTRQSLWRNARWSGPPTAELRPALRQAGFAGTYLKELKLMRNVSSQPFNICGLSDPLSCPALAISFQMSRCACGRGLPVVVVVVVTVVVLLKLLLWLWLRCGCSC